MGLKYIGDGSFIAGIPARDLTDEEVKTHGGEKLLIGSGLYAKETTRKKKASEDDKEK